MKRKVLSVVLALCLIMATGAPALAAASESRVIETVKALGIMAGDQNGNLNLDSRVTRAEFAKMMSAASVYKDTIGEGGGGFSLFKDVKSNYWASEYIRLALQEGWMVGYTDGTFRPNNTITLEEACSALLKLLGYDSSSLAGTFPQAQLSKASALGLRDQVSAAQGQQLTRRQCMYMFYNLLTADNSSGQVYATTLGYTVTNGEVDYMSVLQDGISGPFISDGSQPSLPFSSSSATVYRNGSESSLSSLSQYDVYYYSTNLQTVWIYNDRISGSITELAPSASSPSSVTVAGKSYSIGSPDAQYKLSALSGGKIGSTVTLLLGMDGTVVDVLTGADVDFTYYGVVQSSSRIAGTEDDSSKMQTRIEVACTNGAVQTFAVSQDTTYAQGQLVSISVSEGETTVRKLSERSVTGTVNQSGTKIGNMDFAEDIQILDSSEAGYKAIQASRLAGCRLEGSAVRYYTLDKNGNIDNLILDDVTGDIWQYGYMISAVETSLGNMNFAASYTYIIDGVTSTISTSNSGYSINSGEAFAIGYNSDGSIKTIKSIEELNITELNSVSAKSGNATYTISDDVQVYLKDNGGYYLTTLSGIDTQSYKVTGYYDNFGCEAGGHIRLIIAEER